MYSARQIGILQIVLSGFCFGFLGLFGKKVFELGVSPGEFLALRFLLAWFFLFLAMGVLCPKRIFLPARDLLRCAALGICGYAIFSFCFFGALEIQSASLTVFLLYTYPLMVTLGAWLFFHEKMASLWVLPLELLGMALLVWGQPVISSWVGIILGLLSALFYSAYILASSHWLRRVDPYAATLHILFFAGLTLALFHLRRWNFPPEAFVWVGGASVISTVLAMGLFLASLEKLSSAEASLLSTMEPVMGVILAAIFLQEKLTFIQWSGGAIVLVTMILVGKASD